MKLNGTEYFQGMGDARRYPVCLLRKGQVVRMLYDDETSPVFKSIKRMKRGEYIVIAVRPGYVDPKTTVYELAQTRKNAKYRWSIYTIPMDKAINAGAIEVLS